MVVGELPHSHPGPFSELKVFTGPVREPRPGQPRPSWDFITKTINAEILDLTHQKNWDLTTKNVDQKYVG